jgi:hypothetical protein
MYSASKWRILSGLSMMIRTGWRREEDEKNSPMALV